MAKKKGKDKAEGKQLDDATESEVGGESESAVTEASAEPDSPKSQSDGPEESTSELEDHAPLVLGAEAADGEAGDEDDHDALAEFASYDSLDDEYPEDDEDAAATDEASEGDVDDQAALVTPKDRRLAEMRLEARIEAVIFAAQKPLKTAEVVEILADPELTEEHVQAAIDEIVDFYDNRQGGFRLHYLKRLGYQFQTSENAGAIMERMFASRPRPISRAALETLSIIAYRQPVTRAEVEFIRGVDAGSIFKTLLERDLIKCVGRKEIVGRPMLFGTTDNFLTVFNLSSIKDLPPLESFQPSREVMQGAMDKIAEGEDGGLIDVEEYIADNTRGEYEGDDLELASEDGLLEEADETAATEAAVPAHIEGASAADSAAPESDSEDQDTDAEDTTPAAESSGASAASEEPFAGNDDDHGTDADTEVALPDGHSEPEGGGDLDR